MESHNVINRQNGLLLAALTGASFASVLMLVLRAFYAGQWRYEFLVWNLFLAWLPLLLAMAAASTRRLRWLIGGLWLLFFPNAMYLVTDIMHLRRIDGVPVWYDAILLFSFAITGLYLGFISLTYMQHLIWRRHGRSAGGIFAAAALILSSFGVYIGRFLRLNSWDVLTRPLQVAQDVGGSLQDPSQLIKTAAVTLLLAVLFSLLYAILRLAPSTAVAARAFSGD